MLNLGIPHTWGLGSKVASEIEVKGVTPKYGQNLGKLQRALTQSSFELERRVIPPWKALGKGF